MEFGMEEEFINIPRDQMIVADESIFEQYNMPWKRVLIKNNLNSVNCCSWYPQKLPAISGAASDRDFGS